MELTENERLMLVRKKEEIYKISNELITGKLTAEEQISKINEIISLLSTIESYAKPDRELIYVTQCALHIIHWIQSGLDGGEMQINMFCTVVNSIKFDFTQRRILLPKKIVIHIENMISKITTS